MCCIFSLLCGHPFLNFEITPQKLCDQILTFKGDPEKNCIVFKNVFEKLKSKHKSILTYRKIQLGFSLFLDVQLVNNISLLDQSHF